MVNYVIWKTLPTSISEFLNVHYPYFINMAYELSRAIGTLICYCFKRSRLSPVLLLDMAYFSIVFLILLMICNLSFSGSFILPSVLKEDAFSFYLVILQGLFQGYVVFGVISYIFDFNETESILFIDLIVIITTVGDSLNMIFGAIYTIV